MHQSIERLSALSDDELLRAVAEHDTNAFAELMGRHQGRVFRLAYCYTGEREAALDLTQDIFVKVFKAAKDYVPEARFLTWLYRIITNHCLNYVRGRRRDPLSQSVDQSAVGPEDNGMPGMPAGQLDTLARRERAQAVRKALDSLPQRQKMAIVLLRYDGLRYREIGEALGCSLSAAEALVHRGMEALKERLKGIEDQEV
jgi:RNA polymerase sigma-70 factor (ECF subfamily)